MVDFEAVGYLLHSAVVGSERGGVSPRLQCRCRESRPATKRFLLFILSSIGVSARQGARHERFCARLALYLASFEWEMGVVAELRVSLKKPIG